MTPLDAAQSRPLEGGASFSLGNRVERVIWGAIWLVFARFTPPAFHPWRALLLRLFGAKLGRAVRVHGSAKVWLPGNLELGDGVLIGPHARLYNQGRITIGTKSVISQRAHLCASSHDLTDPHFQLVLKPIVLGEQCWVAAEAFVGPGVRLGDRAVVAARAALFDDADADGIYLGNPAKRVGTRRLRER